MSIYYIKYCFFYDHTYFINFGIESDVLFWFPLNYAHTTIIMDNNFTIFTSNNGDLVLYYCAIVPQKSNKNRSFISQSKYQKQKKLA